MKLLIVSTLAVAFAAAPAFAQQPPTDPATSQGQVAVHGAEPSAVVTTTVEAPTPQPTTAVSVATEVVETPTATIETTTEIAAPVSDRPALDPANPRAPEVQAVVASKKNYTTADIVKAQHEAMLATPVSQPTTITTTTTTTQKTGG